MTKYYLEVIKPNISICIDTDIHYHHQFKIGDIILVEYDIKSTTLKFSGVSCYYSLTSGPEFTLDWDKIQSARLSIATLITKGYAVDVTKNVDRDFKLRQLGI